MIFSTVFIQASSYFLREPACQELVEPLPILLSGGICQQQPFTKRLSEAANGCERPQPSRSLTAIEVLIGTGGRPVLSAPPNPVARTSRFHFDGSLPNGHDSLGLCRIDSCFDPSGVKAGRTPLLSVRSLLWQVDKFFSTNLESRIQRENINMSTGASSACKVCLSQYDIDRRFRLTIRNDQVDPQTGFPRIFSGWFVLIKSTEILQTADLCQGDSPVNSCLRKVELDRVQGCWINNSFDFFHREISRKPTHLSRGICFMGITIPPQMLKRSPRFGGNEPFLGPLALGIRRIGRNACTEENEGIKELGLKPRLRNLTCGFVLSLVCSMLAVFWRSTDPSPAGVLSRTEDRSQNSEGQTANHKR